MNRKHPPAWATAIGGPFNRGPNPDVALAVLWALDAAGTYGTTAREIAEATGLDARNVIGCLANLRTRWGVCFTRSDASGYWARHFAAFVPTAEAESAVAHWLSELAAQRKAKAKASTQAYLARKKSTSTKAAVEQRAKVQRELQATRERKAQERQVADRLRLAKAKEAEANNLLAKRIKGTTQPSLAPVKPSRVTVVMPPDVKVTKCPSPPGRFELLQPAEGGLRSLPIGSYLEKPSAWLQAAGVAA